MSDLSNLNKLEISIYLFLNKFKKVNTILYFIFDDYYEFTCYGRNFPRPDLGLDMGPFPIHKKNEQKLPKMVHIIPNF